MDKDWTITKVSEQPPREWQGPKGTIYYIKVALEGHDKPVEVGKVKPDALSVGQTIYGHIEDTKFPNDKFKAAQRQTNFGGSASATKGSYQPKDEHAIAKAVALKAAVDYVNAHESKVFDDVLGTADQFLVWLEADNKSKEDQPPVDESF